MKSNPTLLSYLTLLLIFISPGIVYPEGTKQVRPDSVATISYAALMIDRNSANYTRFAYVNCPANYRLYIHIKNPGESILFGLKAPSGGINYNLKNPGGTVVLTGTLPNTTGQPGYIRYYHQAIVGPFPSDGGYTPLSYTAAAIADTGNYYFEVTNASGSTWEFELFDFQVVSGLHTPAIPDDTINGRVFSQSWQFYANLSSPFQPFNASFYVYSDDGIVTKLKFNQTHVGEGTIFCNPVGCANTGNFANDRRSRNGNGFTTFPGIAWYKVFLNNPDSTVYPSGVYGSMIGTPYIIPDPNYPPCSGKKYIVVSVNKTGNVQVFIDVPYGTAANDVNIIANVVPGSNNITWNGNDGLGIPVVDGTQLTITVTYVNGLTNLPLWDIEQNPVGYNVYLIRPTNPALQSPLVYWDDSQLNNGGSCPVIPNTVNLTGCDAGTTGCHTWDSQDCHDKMINTWWYSASSSTATLGYFYTGTPANPVGHGDSRCGPGMDTIYATVNPFQTVDWYTDATGGTPLLVGDTTFITPFLLTTTTFYAEARNDTSGCLSVARTPVVVSIKTIPNLVFTPSSQSICSNDTTNIAISTNSPGQTVTYSWTVTASSPDVTGYSPGTGNLIHQLLTETGNHSDTVTYHVIPSSQGCDGPVYDVQVVVNPRPHITNNPMTDTVCSGNTTNIELLSSCENTTFNWTASILSGNVTGFSDGTGSFINQTLVNALPALGVVNYSILPNAGGCIGNDTNYHIAVKPNPHITNDPLTAQICSNNATNILLTSDLTGSTFTWTATGSSGNVSGFSAGSGTIIIQTLVISGYNSETVTYHIIPFANGCYGDTTNFIVTVFPEADVYFIPPSSAICSQQTTNIQILSHVTGTTFTWIASASSPNLSGFSAGSGNLISQTILNSGTTIESVTYTVTPFLSGCLPGPSQNVIVTVHPTPVITNSITHFQQCNPATTNIILQSSVSGTTFTWTASGSSPNVNGFSAGSGPSIIQTLQNSGFNIETVTYTVAPLASGCTGTAVDFVVTVSPVPDIYFNPPSQIICSGVTSNIQCLSHVNGALFAWTASGSSGNVSGFSPGNGNSIQQTLINSGYNIETVTYHVTPVANGCTGNPSNVIVTVDPLPVVSLQVCWDPLTTSNAQPINLKGGIPPGGTYSGEGVTTGIFYPGVAGVGTHTINYSYVNGFGCGANASQTITVVSAPAFNCKNTLTDIRDNQQYGTVQIGTQCWLTVNLNYGNAILSSQMQRDNCIPEKYCFNDNPVHCISTGGLYQWDEMMKFDNTSGTQGFCPPGWHIPTENDWTMLFKFYISNGFAGSPLKYTGFSGFDAFLSGVRHENKDWSYRDFAIMYWSSTSHGQDKAWSHGMNSIDPSVSYYPAFKSNAFAVRCIKD